MYLCDHHLIHGLQKAVKIEDGLQHLTRVKQHLNFHLANSDLFSYFNTLKSSHLPSCNKQPLRLAVSQFEYQTSAQFEYQTCNSILLA